MGGKQIFLLIIFPGFHLGYVCVQLDGIDIIHAMAGSCVELPCTHTFNETIGLSNVVWFAGKFYGEQIATTKNSSSVMKEYKGRTSLLLGNNSCALRIDPVRRGDETRYYSRIAENIDAHDFNDSLYLLVTDSPEEPELLMSEYLSEEKANIIRCRAEHTCGSRPPSLQWNKPGLWRFLVTNQSVEISPGYWREESELTYIPSYEDDGSPVRCTATYPNGRKAERSEEMKIHFSPRYVTVTIIGEGRITEGSDVSLICTSISKPAVQTYEWYKGQNRTKLPHIGWKMTVRNVTRDTEPYSCAAINDMGRGESALTQIPVLYEGSGHSAAGSKCNVVLLASLGTVCPLLLAALIASIYWRWRPQKVGSRAPAEPPEAEPPDDTYTDLVTTDANNYHELKPLKSKHKKKGGDAAHPYMNARK